MNITLCHGCELGQGDFPNQLRKTLHGAAITAQVGTTDCMSGCSRASTIAFRSAGKTAYLFGDLTPADLPHLITFAQHYAASADGNLPDARVLGPLRMKAIARIPG